MCMQITYPWMFMATSFIIGNTHALCRTKCSSRGEWIHKVLVCPLHRYSMATKRTLSLTLPKSVYAPQQPVLSERNQVQRKTIYSTNTNMKSFTWNSREDMIRKQVVSGAGTGRVWLQKNTREHFGLKYVDKMMVCNCQNSSTYKIRMGGISSIQIIL